MTEMQKVAFVPLKKDVYVNERRQSMTAQYKLVVQKDGRVQVKGWKPYGFVAGLEHILSMGYRVSGNQKDVRVNSGERVFLCTVQPPEDFEAKGEELIQEALACKKDLPEPDWVLLYAWAKVKPRKREEKKLLDEGMSALSMAEKQKLDMNDLPGFAAADYGIELSQRKKIEDMVAQFQKAYDREIKNK